MFWHIELRQLHTKQFCTQLTKAYVAEMSCNQLLIDTYCYVIAHNQLTYIKERSNEPYYENIM